VGEPFAHRLRVRYAECDAQGVVFNAHYLAYFDISITELWRAAFGSYQAMVERGVDVVVAHAELTFEGPARFDDELRLEIGVARLGASSILTRHQVWRQGKSLTRADLLHVMVDPTTLAKTPIPDWVRAGLAPWTVATPA
jgi:acyl-CoA thioester hydrolase